MIKSRLGLKVSGLCALLLGLMAFATSAAQAEAGAVWMMNNANVTPSLEPWVKIVQAENNHMVLLSELSKKKVELLCTGVALENVKLGTEGKVNTGGKAVFTGCIFKWGGVIQAKCVPHSGGSAEGTIKTESTHSLMRLHNGEGVLLSLPDKNETFVTVILGKEGELNECAAGEKLSVSGEVSWKDCEGKFKVEQLTHLFVEAPPLTELYILNKTAEHKATIDGSTILALDNPHLNLTWSGLPN